MTARQPFPCLIEVCCSFSCKLANKGESGQNPWGCVVAADPGHGSGFPEALGVRPRQTSGTEVMTGFLSSEEDKRGRSHALVCGYKREMGPDSSGGWGSGQRSMKGWAGLLGHRSWVFMGWLPNGHQGLVDRRGSCHG